MKGSEIVVHILDILEESLPYYLPEETLQRNLSQRIKVEIPQLQFDAHILFLQQNKCIKAIAGKLGEIKPQWRITEVGQGERTQ